MRGSLRLFLSVLMVGMFLAGPLSAQTVELPGVNATLRYAETEVIQAQPKKKCTGGGLLGAMNCVTERIEGAGEPGSGSGSAAREVEKSAASASFSITPVLIPVRNSEKFQLRLKVDGGTPAITGDMDPAARAAVERDAHLVRERLRRWRTTIAPDAALALRGGEPMTVSLTDPFEGLQKLALQDPVAFDVSMPVESFLRSLAVLDPGGTELERLDEKTPFRLRLSFDSAPDSPPLTVTASWPGGSERIPVEATDDPAVFESGWRYIRPLSWRAMREVPGLVGASEDTSGTAADLFAGEWVVTHSGGEMGEAQGLARVAENGGNVRMFLKTGSEIRRFESFEMVATRDRREGKNTLDVRFREKPDGEAWGPPAADSTPEGRVVFVADDATHIAFAARGSEKTLDIALPEAPPEKYRIALMQRPDGNLSGAWSIEKPDGNLASGGQQSWGQKPEIVEVVVLEDQRPGARELGSYADFMADDNPTNAEYIREAPPGDRDRRTDYPFREDAQNDSNRRTLMIYGHNLPQRGADALILESGEETIAYALLAYPDEGKDPLFDRGWAKAKKADKAPGDYTALVVRAEFEKGTLPGMKGLAVNGARGIWHLDFADAVVYPQFAHAWREDMHSGEKEYEPTETPYIGDTIYLTMHEQSPVPHEALDVKLFHNGKLADVLSVPRAADGDADRGAGRAPAGDPPAYRSAPIRLVRAGLPREEENAEEGEETVLEVAAGDRLEAELVNPFLTRSVPLRLAAQVVAGPGDLGPTWKDALRRAARCYGDDEVDFDSMTNEEAGAYSEFILTENLLQVVWPQFFGLPSLSSIEFSKGDHAAAILIRDEFLANLNTSIPELINIANDKEKLWQFYQTRKTSTMPFWEIMTVQGPGEGMESELGAFLASFGEDAADIVVSPIINDMIRDYAAGAPSADAGSWRIGELVDSITTWPERYGMSPHAAHAYALRKTQQALVTLIERASNAHARARQAGDCNLEELILIAGQDAPQLVQRILPRLVRRTDDGSGWEPDFVAQGYVKSLHVAGAATRALESYARVDDAYKAMALALVTAGASAALSAGGYAVAGSYMMLAADAADLIVFGSDAFEQYLESQPRIEYAQGATAGGVSQSFFEEAEAMKTEGWEAVAGLLGPAVGMAAGLGAIDDAAAASRGARVLDDIDALDKVAIARLTPDEQRDLLAYFGDLQRRNSQSALERANNFGRTLDEKEAADLARLTDYLDDNGVDAAGSSVRLKTPAEDEVPASTTTARAAPDDQFGDPTARPSTPEVIDEAAARAAAEDDAVKTARLDTRDIDDMPENTPTVRAESETGTEAGGTARRDMDDIDEMPENTPTVREGSGTGTEAGRTARRDMDDIDDMPENTPTVREGSGTGTEAGRTARRDMDDIDDMPENTPTVRAESETGTEAARTARRDMDDIDDMSEIRESVRYDEDTGSVVRRSAPADSRPRTGAAAREEALTAGPIARPITTPDGPIFTGRQRYTFRVEGSDEPLTINTGKRLGGGVGTQAFDHADDKGKVYRLTNLEDEELSRLDEVGRARLEAEEAGADGLFSVTARDSEPVIVVDGAGNRWKVEVAEKAESNAAARIAENPNGKLTQGQNLAINAAVRHLNRRGLAWTDNHMKNFDLVPVEGTEDQWKVVIFDTGGVFPVRGNTAYERWQNARRLQRAINTPPEEWIEAVNAAKRRMARAARVQNEARLDSARADLRKLIRERFNEIYEEFNDVIAWEEVFPGGGDAFIGSPGGWLDREQARGLLSMPPDVSDQIFTANFGVTPPAAPSPP